VTDLDHDYQPADGIGIALDGAILRVHLDRPAMTSWCWR